jgi:3-oxoacyl-[acyl-carrier-protein] synthase III
VSITRSIVRGCGSYLPKRIMLNAELAAKVNSSAEWIEQRTGIKQRHLAADGETTADIATIAAERALEDAGLSAQDIDLIILATSTPDNTFPATATTVQDRLGIHHGFAFDIQAVCSGFVFALSVADNYIRTGQSKRALVIGAETFSRILDWEDRSTCVLFGDGGGAIVIEPGEGRGDSSDRGVISTHLRSDGQYNDKLYVDGGPSSTQTVGHLRMQGQEVFRRAVGFLSEVIEAALDASDLETKDIDWFVPHQANRRIIEATARKMGLSWDKVILTVGQHANTSAASIPLALRVALDDGKIKPGDLVLLEAMGGGFTWGSALVRW